MDDFLVYVCGQKEKVSVWWMIQMLKKNTGDEEHRGWRTIIPPPPIPKTLFGDQTRSLQ